MYTSTKKLLAIALVVLMTTTISAQKINQDELRGRVAEKVAQMNDYISYLSDKSKNEKTRIYYRDKAMNLFIGKCQAYEENGVTKKGVTMQITSKTHNTITTKLMREYFWNLIKNLPFYTEVKITATDAASMKVSELKAIGDNMYECTCEYVQVFIGLRDGEVVYKDRTTKYIKCRVLKEDTEDGYDHVVLLGDTYAVSTE